MEGRSVVSLSAHCLLNRHTGVTIVVLVVFLGVSSPLRLTGRQLISVISTRSFTFEFRGRHRSKNDAMVGPEAVDLNIICRTGSIRERKGGLGLELLGEQKNWK